MTKKWWAIIFLGVFTSGGVALEIWASVDGNPNTTPWTDYIVEYVPEELAAFLIGGFCIWLWMHFRARYKRKKDLAEFGRMIERAHEEAHKQATDIAAEYPEEELEEFRRKFNESLGKPPTILHLPQPRYPHYDDDLPDG